MVCFLIGFRDFRDAHETEIGTIRVTQGVRESNGRRRRCCRIHRSNRRESKKKKLKIKSRVLPVRGARLCRICETKRDSRERNLGNSAGLRDSYVLSDFILFSITPCPLPSAFLVASTYIRADRPLSTGTALPGRFTSTRTILPPSRRDRGF